MSTEASESTSPTDKSTVIDDLPTDALPMGVDGADSVHYYTRRDHVVVVETPRGTVERRIELDGRSLTEWIAYVDDERGWATLNYADTFADVLTEALQ